MKVFSYDGSSITVQEFGISANVSSDPITVTDQSPPIPKAYYRFEAEYVEPEP
ncbi:MAG: hypothetical protein AAGJ79_09865 [Verrucomicrobiota bacterium]